MRVFEELGGRSIEVTHISEADLKAAWQVGIDEISRSHPALQLRHAQDDSIDMREMLKKIPMQLTTVQEYARQVHVPAQAVIGYL